MDSVQSYLTRVTGLGDDRFFWLNNYLRKSQQFLEKHIHPVQLGSIENESTRVIVADFPRNLDLSLRIQEQPVKLSELADWLTARPSEVHGRLVVVSSTSGVSQQLIEAQLQLLDPMEKLPSADSIILTCPRKAGQAGTHPVKGHVSRLPDPQVLGCVASHTWVDPDFLLRFLDENKHLTYRSYVERSLHVRELQTSVQHWGDFQVAVDQGNHITIALNQETHESPWTMIILAIEDNCLGVDMNATVSPYLQPLLASAKTPSERFIEALHRLATMRDQRRLITLNPLALVPTYSKALIAAFGSHVELYQRHWNQTYEPYANTSVVYGYAYHRDAVRQLARRYATHLRYIDHTLHSLARFLSYSFNPTTHGGELEPLIQDFNHFAREVGAMKLVCDQFLEQQVSKLALQDARTQMQEAKDLKRLSYLAFIFVPLSLTSSFFGMNVKELDSGPTPVWVFVVTALGILLGSMCFVWLSAASLLPAIGRGVELFLQGIWNELCGSRKTSKPATMVHKPPKPQQHSSILKPKRKRNWRFWQPTEQQYTQPFQPFSAPPPDPYVASMQEYSVQQTSAAPLHWTSVPQAYSDPSTGYPGAYSSLLEQYPVRPPMHSIETPIPEPPGQYPDRPRPMASLPESDYP